MLGRKMLLVLARLFPSGRPHRMGADKTIKKRRSISPAADMVLSNYLSNRFRYSADEIAHLLGLLINQRFSFKDDRFVNMLLMFEQNLDEINIAVKVRVARDLTKMHKGNELLVKIIEGLDKDLPKMNFSEVAVMMWVLAKNQIKDGKIVIKLTDRICAILKGNVIWKEKITQRKKSKKENIAQIDKIAQEIKSVMEQQDPKDENKEQDEILLPEIQQKEQTSITVSPLSCSLVLWSLSNLQMQSKHTCDILVKQHIRPNLHRFDLSMLVLCLSSCVKLRYQRKSIAHLYEHITTRTNQLSQLSTLFMIVLLKATSKVQVFDPEFVQKIAQALIDKNRAEGMSSKFASLALCYMPSVKNKEIIAFFVNIVSNSTQQCKTADLVMTLKGILNFYQQNQFKKEIKNIVQEIEQRYKSIPPRDRQFVNRLAIKDDFPSKFLREQAFKSLETQNKSSNFRERYH